MSFIYFRTIRLADTDAAHVAYFASILNLCHEAYEESLAQFGIDFKDLVMNPAFAVVIAKTEAEFLRPMFCGDKVLIEVMPQQLRETEFEIVYSIMSATEPKQQLVQAKTRHVSINPQLRKRVPLPDAMLGWLQEI